MSGYRISQHKDRSRFGSRGAESWGYWSSSDSKDLELNNTIDIMMDCPHHINCVKKIPTNLKLACTVCKSVGSPWLCLSCGVVHCGRYVNGHAKQHYADNKPHSIAIDCNSYEAYCYNCDEYVPNDFVPRLIFDKLNVLHNESSGGINFGFGGHESDQEGASGESVMSSRLPSIAEADMEESNSSNFSTSSLSSANNDDRFKQPTNTCDQNHSGNSRKRNVLDFGVSGNEIKKPRTKGSGSSKNAVNNGKARSRSNNGRFQSATKGANSNRLSPNNGQLQRNLRRKSGETFVDDLNHSSVDDGGVAEVKKRRLNSDDGSGTSKSDNNNNSNSANTTKSVKNNSRRTKENESMDCKDKHGIVGLRNLGNTCFMNSVLQSLSKINEFSYYMSHIPPPDQLKSTLSAAFNGSRAKPFAYSTRSRKNLLLASQNSIINNNLERVDMSEEFLTNELRKILILLNTKGSAAVSPDGLFTIIWEVMPRFRGYQQQDAHEFLRYMLDRLHIELIHVFPTWGLMGSKSKTDDGVKNGGNGVNHDVMRHRNSTDAFLSTRGWKGKGSIVTSMFGGSLQNEVRCCVCGIESKKNEPFLDLSLDVPIPTNGEARLEDCLSRFVDIEELNDTDKYFCSHCKAHQKSTKRFWIYILPNVLCLHLKRFRWANYLRTKLDHYVQFPLTDLDMSEYLLRNNHTTRGSSDAYLYDLAAVIVHHGTGVGTGHYTAFAKNDGQWYHFNDSTVKPSEESVVAKCKAYILFYTRKEVKS